MNNKKATTLPQFVKNFPKDKCFTKDEYFHPTGISFDYNTNLSYSDKIKYVGSHYKTSKRLFANENCIYYIEESKKVGRCGKVFYPVTFVKNSIYINSHEVSLNCDPNMIFQFLQHIGINWFTDLFSKCNMLGQIVKNKTIFRRIITGRIYNEETLYKSVASCMYKVKNVSWKHVRKYCNLNSFDRISLTDLVAFTRNPEASIDVLDNMDGLNYSNIYSDLIKCAIKLNQIVDFTWSDKRIELEHKKQIEILKSKELSEKKTVPIYDCTIEFPNGMSLLNTEKDIFSEGSFMHHCIYTCYYPQILSHSYIAFHLVEPEECTLGVFIHNNRPVLNQIYKKYDKPVLDSTKKYAETFIEKYSDELMELFKQKIKKEEPQLPQLPIWQDELLPW